MKPPYDLEGSLAVARRFTPATSERPGPSRFAIWVGQRIVLVELVQVGETSVRALFRAGTDRSAVRRAISWMIFADLDLGPFYRLVVNHPVLGPLVRRFRGVKPLRPAGLFEMAAIAITEQQISLAAAYAIRTRLTRRFGMSIDGYWVFPEPRVLARASLSQLRECAE